MTSTAWTFGWSWGAGIAGLLALAACVWLVWRNLRLNPGHVALRRLEWMRLGIVGLLLFTLARPERVKVTTVDRDPVVAILADRSGSMETEDVVQGPKVMKRSTWVADRLGEKFWSVLEPKYRVVVRDFAAPGPNDIDPATDLSAGLESALGESGNLRAVLLLSDGDHNAGPLPSGVATKLRGRDIPVYAVGVGADRYLPDVELVNVMSPAYGLIDDHLTLPFTLQNRLAREVRTTVTLRRKDGAVEATREIRIPPGGQAQESLTLVPKEEGQFTYEVSIPVEKEERIPGNNVKTFPIAFRREVLKVLLIETLPRWEYRFLRNALQRDPGVEVKTLLLHPEIGVGGGRDYLQRFPEKEEELSAFDVIFIGDVGVNPGQLTPEQCEKIKGLVEQQGSGIIFLPGLKGNQLSLESTALAALNPVVLDPAQPAGAGFPLESKLALTARGAGHLLTLLDPDPQRNAALWQSLPGFFWNAGVDRARPGSTVLAVHATARNAQGRIPLLATRVCGNGKSLFMGTDSAWRWRRGVEDVHHYRFWGQVVRWMAHQRHLANDEGIRFFHTPESPRKGEKVFLHSTVFDRSGYPAKDGTVTVTITSPAGRSQQIPLQPDPGGWGVFTGEFTPTEGGELKIKVDAPQAGRTLNATIAIETPRTERAGLPVRSPVLREIAAITGGRLLAPDTLAEAIKSLELLPERRPQEERFRLWCHPAWAGSLVFLLAVYWTLRKWTGMI